MASFLFPVLAFKLLVDTRVDVAMLIEPKEESA
jgi:hypothetical protein